MSDFPSGGLVEGRAKGGIEFSVSPGFCECGAPEPARECNSQIKGVRAQNKVRKSDLSIGIIVDEKVKKKLI